MLVQMLPEQISEHWDYIKFTIQESVPKELLVGTPQLNNVLEALLAGYAHTWFYITDEGKVKGCCITVINTDLIIKEKALRIYSAYASETMNMSEWKECYQTIVSFARSKKCTEIDAITTLSGVVSLAKSFGADDRFHYLKWRL